MTTGKISAAELARAEARRARNALTWAWRKNPSLPGSTIDLGEWEGAFLASASGAGVDVGTLMPAVRDWLQWRFKRTQIDRTDAAAWTRALRTELPRRIMAADRAMVWVRLGNPDGRTKQGRALKAALRAGGEAHARALGFGLARPPGETGADVDVDAAQGGLGPARSAPQWRASAPDGPDGRTGRRAMPDRTKAPPQVRDRLPGRPGRPRKTPESQDEIAELASVIRQAPPQVRRMFAALSRPEDQLCFLRTLRDLTANPDDPAAQGRWTRWVIALHKRGF
ncbi:hypothetical protein E7811_15320 [Aliigemmobacter aestuarii]|uniref:Uncharacterized protein n=1 Tax=Aliigemmobacter aestuarii TaxID=1445661 RepID=A0A4S3MKC4_9RHOB|nr:hypothetical protein [Gemmobacter aestuarii]THD82412.1 hypothetical protein E7811_15320 [Gemmobacter aestuarii]